MPADADLIPQISPQNKCGRSIAHAGALHKLAHVADPNNPFSIKSQPPSLPHLIGVQVV